MIRTFILIVALTGLWWVLIGNKMDDAEQSAAPVQLTRLFQEADKLGTSKSPDLCLNDALLRTRSCPDQDELCLSQIELYVGRCLLATGQASNWCKKVPEMNTVEATQWQASLCELKALQNASCLQVAAAIPAFCSQHAHLADSAQGVPLESEAH
jgi:hypothetical protein